MAVDLGVVGLTEGPWTRSWTSRDTLLYALGVGAGQHDPLTELGLTTEHAEGHEQQVLPAFGIALAQSGGLPRKIGDVDPTGLVHAEQSFTVHRPLAPEGSVHVRRTVTDILDMGSGALVVTRTDVTDPATEEAVLSTRASVFIRGAGGFGGDRGTSSAVTWSLPERAPDAVLRFTTSLNQALLYRLSGDLDPLHGDPAFAARGGLGRPTLHGLCTYGITCRLLIGAFCGGDTHRVSGMEGRFTRPVVPGDELIVCGWSEGDQVLFRTISGSGWVVLDHGRMLLTEGT